MKLPAINTSLPESSVLELLEAHFLNTLTKDPKYDIYDDRDVYCLIGTKAYGLVMKAYDNTVKRCEVAKEDKIT
jgi:hypothetical protein